MRKIILEFIPDDRIKKLQGKMLEKIDSIELLELLRLDFEKGIKVGLMQLKVKKGFTIEDVELPEHVNNIDVLQSEGDKYICIVKVQVPREFKKLMREFKLDLIWTTPSLLSNDKGVTSVIGPEEDLKKFLSLMKNLGEIRNITFQKAAYHEHDILSVLTKKQREIIVEAKKSGYYDYPRKINAEGLAKKIGISKATVVEHLRKAEERIIENILAGS
jgi:predicted DNA binding protein